MLDVAGEFFFSIFRGGREEVGDWCDCLLLVLTTGFEVSLT